jgi:hypothetical protein
MMNFHFEDDAEWTHVCEIRLVHAELYSVGEPGGGKRRGYFGRVGMGAQSAKDQCQLDAYGCRFLPYRERSLLKIGEQS